MSQQPTGQQQLLATKFHSPVLRPGLVARPRLTDLGSKIDRPKLVLLSAPPGFGKTTLAAQLVGNVTPGFAWISLATSENDPELFWRYVVAALERVYPSIGDSSGAMFRSGDPELLDSALTFLVNEIAETHSDVHLVLDDYHVIEQPSIHAGISFLLEHAPSNFQLLMTSRTDPPLQIGRMRVQGELFEVRAADLRFTESESSMFINGMMGLELADAQIEVLEARTEGWAAGLQLAALSIQGRDDPDGFLARFSGSDHFILDYLVEEVLSRQRDDVRRFLLQTSILAGFNAALCDAVTGDGNAVEMLQLLANANLFLIALDDQRNWYRYHHLFADALKVIATSERVFEGSSHHACAADWYATSEMWDEAVYHAFESTDHGLAASTIEAAWPEMESSRRSRAWLEWANNLTPELIQQHPFLITGVASANLSIGELEAGETFLYYADQWLAENSESDEELAGQVAIKVANSRAYLAQSRGDMHGTAEHTQQALSLIPQEDFANRAGPYAVLSLAQWANGDLVEAEATMTGAVVDAERSGNFQFIVTAGYVLSRMRVALGNLSAARVACQWVLDIFAERPGEPWRGVADAHLGLGEIDLLHGDVQAALRNLDTSKSLADRGASPFWRYRRCLLESQLLSSEGDFPGALAMLDEAEDAYVRGPVPEVHPPHAMKVRLWLKQGRLDLALKWMDDRILAANDELSYLHEFDYLTLARILIAVFESERSPRAIADASMLLRRLGIDAKAGDRTVSAIEALVLMSLTSAAVGQSNAAMDTLKDAVALAEPEGIVSVFVSEGVPIQSLLRQLAAASATPYVHILLDAFGNGDAGISGASTGNPAQLVDPLTQRELEVLRLVSVGMRNQEIADQLYISVATVKRHISNSYRKLGVTHRTEAIARAGELSLL